jgi:hypothetical protein
MKTLRACAAALLAGALLGACASAPPAPEGLVAQREAQRVAAWRAGLEAQREQALGGIRALIDGAAGGETAGCRLLRLGRDGCGGADHVLAYAPEALDTERLAQLATQYDALQRLLRLGQPAGACRPPPPARALWRDGRCAVEAGVPAVGASAP